MKKYLLLIVACFVMTASYAQQQVATLSHNGEITMYYGANALDSAYTKAADGDVITLSAGSFNAVDISKLITIRGAGMGVKIDSTDTYTEPSLIVGDFKVSANGNETSHFTLEAVRNDNKITIGGDYSQFVKCNFYDAQLYDSSGKTIQNCTFAHCYVSHQFHNSRATFTGLNSYFKDASFTEAYSSLYYLTNCVVEIYYSGALSGTSLKNCIIINTSNSAITLNNNYTTAYNTLWAGTGSNPFKDFGDGHYNYVQSTYDNLFVDGSFYKLTDEAKKYVGSDGKELGIYGGNLPFEPTPTNLQITKFEVASKTNAEGKLSVDIEVGQTE